MPPFLNTAWHWFDRYLIPVDDPGSRLFGLNLLASVALIALFLRWQARGQARRPRTLRALKALLFNRRYWWNRSTRADYGYYLLNSALKAVLVLPFLELSFYFSSVTLKMLLSGTGAIPSLAPGFLGLLAFSLGAFVFDDLLRFLHHLAMHKVPLLRKLHSVHHSATVLTPFTLYRLHPLESMMATARNSLSAGISLGAFLWLFDGAESSLHSLFGTATFGLLFNFLGSNLRHSHVAFSFGGWERLFISPAQHQRHHHRAGPSVNFGVSLALWDSLAGTLELYRPGSRARFGISRSGKNKPRRKTMHAKLKWPQAFAALVPAALLLGFASIAAGEQKPKILIYDLAEQNYESAFREVADEMGVEIELNHGPAAILLSHLKDPDSPEKPDLVIQQDVLNLGELHRLNLLSPIFSPALEASVPDHLRNLREGWAGLSYHARTLAYNPDLVGPDEVKRYEDLAHPKWKGQFCLRKATYSYTRALIAGMIHGNGLAETERVLRGWVANNDKPIYVGDLYVMQALDAGECAFGLVNTDFFARYKTKVAPESNLQLLWMNQGDRGVHVNVMGVALTARSEQKDLAVRFLERVASHEGAMQAFAQIKQAYPANPAFRVRGFLEGLGNFRADRALPSDITRLDGEAKALALKVGYNP